MKNNNITVGSTGMGPTGAINDFMIMDYMNMVIKEGIKDAKNEYRSTTIIDPGATGPRSLNALATSYPANSQAPTGVSRVLQIAQANQQTPLANGVTLSFSNVSFVPAPGATLGGIGSKFGVGSTSLASYEVNPQLSFKTIPTGVTAVQYAGASGTTSLPVPSGASFQTLAQQKGISGAAINSALLWPNLNVVGELLTPGQPIHIPTFSKGITGPSTLLSEASAYNLTLESFVNENAGSNIFGATAGVEIPQANELSIRQLLDRLKAQGFGSKLASLAGRSLLHGLRIPTPSNPSPTGPKQGLYEITNQQSGISGITAGSSLRLTYSGQTGPSWLTFQGSTGATGGTGTLVKPHISTKIGPTAMAHIQQLSGATAYYPTATFAELEPYHIHQRSFTVAHSITWNLPHDPLGATGIVPVSPTGAYGNGQTNAEATTNVGLGSNFILPFPHKLQSLLQLQPNGPTATAFTLNKTNHTSGNSSEVISPYAWTSMVQVKISKIKENTGQDHEFVYAVEGGSENDKLLLANLLTNNASAQNVFLLYPAHAAQKGQKSSNIALTSDTEPTVFVFHTNLAVNQAPTGSTQDGDITGLLQEFWQADEVSEGGFYIYYRTKEAKGLPSYLFSEQPTASITLLLTCPVPKQDVTKGSSFKLPSYVNSVVLDTAIETRSESLFIQPIGPTANFDPKLQVKTPTIHPGTVAFELSRPNPNRLGNHNQGVTHRLDELYSILEARIPTGQTAYSPSKPGLPIGPRNPTQGITATPPNSLIYDVSFPISHLATNRPGLVGGTGPNLLNDPYAGIGATLTVDFNMLDIFGNSLTPSPGPAWISKSIVPGYSDSLITIDSWPHVTKTFKVNSNRELVVTLIFNANYYHELYEANPNNTSALLKAAEAAQKTFQQAWYQLNQPDVEANLISSLAPEQSISVIHNLRHFVTNCWVSITSVVNLLNQNSVLPKVDAISTSISHAVSDSNLLDIFPVSVKIDIQRTGVIDVSFNDVPSVQKVTGHVSPQTQSGLTGHAGVTGRNHLAYFAESFQQAFPNLKVATGQAGPTPSSGEEGKGLWAVRLGATAGATGIYLSLQNKPTYYAPRPVATSLVSRSNVPIYEIPSNQTLNQVIAADMGCTGANCHLKNYTGLDIGILARQFLTAFDEALSPDIAAAAAIASPTDFNNLLSYKQTLASYLTVTKDTAGITGAPQVLPVFDDSIPPVGGPGAAGQALKDELLVGLSRLNKVETIVQCDVKSHWVNSNQHDSSVELFGKISPKVKTKKAAFAFSSSSLPISKGPSGVSHLTALFNINHAPLKQSGETMGGKPDFVDDVTFHVTSLAHQIGNPNGHGYSKEWLSFVQPFELGNAIAPGITTTPPPLNLDIPLPLRAYPTSPALKSQADVPLLPQFGQTLGIGAITTLAKATSWAYQYNYQYTGAAQDTISTTLDFNVTSGNTGMGLTLQQRTLDLVDYLLQFKSSYGSLKSKMANLKLFLNDNTTTASEAIEAKLALTSFCELTQLITNSWKDWKEYQKTHSYQYEIEQMPASGPTTTPNLVVQVKKVSGPSGIYPHTNIAMPNIKIKGFTATPSPPTGPTSVGPNATEMNYRFTAVGTSGSTAPNYLSWDDRNEHPIRTVSFPGLNVLEQENAWAGLGILRNKDLEKEHGTTGPFRPVNPAFVFETPLVRFVNVLNPLLDPAGEIIISNEVSPSTQNVSGYLTSLFTKILDNLPPSSTVKIKFQVSYAYELGPQLPVELPMFLTTPYDYSQATSASFINMVSGNITSWFSEKNLTLVEGSGSIVFDLTIFSTLSSSELPLLRLRKLLLPCSEITHS